MSSKLRSVLLMIVDAALVNLGIYISLLLRFEAEIPAQYIQSYKDLFPLITLITLFFFIGAKLYRRIWQYASLREMLAILQASTYSMAVLVMSIYLFHLPTLPRSIYILSWIMTNVFVGASRISWRLFLSLFSHGKAENLRKLLIIGAGDAGSMLYREIQNNRHLKFKVVGFIDDAPDKQRAILHGVPVLGSSKKIPSLVKELDINDIIVAIPSAPGDTIRRILDICKQTSAKVRILPGIYQTTQKSLMSSVRDIQMEDLLRRKPVTTDLQAIAEYISNKTILVTGAGGSIGSELCRQILRMAPEKLLMLDNCENNLFEIEQELCSDNPELKSKIYPLLIDIREKDKMERAFNLYAPEVVFHAAAYKHVPMMEKYPEEAISNNVIGTRNVAELADSYNAKIFIQVSTDKAVNPTSVMGASKRIAELVIKDLNRNSQTKFAAVRFGNVLGSRGSVIPTFIKQIQKGGPVTITHPDMQRFFMTIPEAVQLIIQAGALAEGGEIFVLDMGEMVKIDDLARDLIRLYGYEPEKDIDIVYTGIRPGEKLYEELFTDLEGMVSTRHERIFISKQELDDNTLDICKSLHLLLKRSFNTRTEIIKFIKEIVPEYQGKEEAVLNLKNSKAVG